MSDNNKYDFVLGAGDGKVIIVSNESLKRIGECSLECPICSLAMSSDNKLLTIGTNDGSIYEVLVGPQAKGTYSQMSK